VAGVPSGGVAEARFYLAKLLRPVTATSVDECLWTATSDIFCKTVATSSSKGPFPTMQSTSVYGVL
jgi:hypothetical protein